MAKRLISPLTSFTKVRVSQNAEKRLTLFNAATNQIREEIQFATDYQIQQSFQDAQIAQQEWYHNHTPQQREQIILNASILFNRRAEEFSYNEVKDTARAISEIKDFDIPSASRALSYYAHVPTILSSGTYHKVDHSFAHVIREPIGLAVGIGAFNYPLMNAVLKSAPALSFGNAMLYKPSELTPRNALLLAEIYEEAGVPSGLFQVLLGDGSIGEKLVSHDKVGKISFTGSLEAGKKIYEAAARMTNEKQQFTKVTLELGGKSALIIHEDADLDNAVNGAIMANWYSNGQVCSNGTRVFVHEAIYEEFLERLIKETDNLKIGDPMNQDTIIGPMISEKQMKRVLEYVRIGQCEDNANLIYGGQRLQLEGLQDGFFLSPAIFADCHDDMTITREEVFGMLMSVMKFNSEDEVLQRSNNSSFGLGAGIYTNDLKRAYRMASKIEAGNVWINTYNLAPQELPWGGKKLSGLGKESGAQAAMEEWTTSKSVYTNID